MYDCDQPTAPGRTPTLQSAEDNTAEKNTSGASAGVPEKRSIAATLAAASDKVMEKCGYLYNEGLDMYYDSYSGLYYHQVRQQPEVKG